MRPLVGHTLWIGNRSDVLRPGQARSAGIEAILDLAVEEAPLPFHREGILLRVPLCDGGGNEPSLLRLAVVSLESLVRARVPTLVVCSAGLSRSPSVAAWACARATGADAHEMLKAIAAGGPTDVAPALWAQLCAAMVSD